MQGGMGGGEEGTRKELGGRKEEGKDMGGEKRKKRKGRRERGRIAETRNQGKGEIEGGGM